MTFPLGDGPIKLAMLGMVEGNGHPYSWSMIINGRYDADALAKCPYPAIIDYVGKQPADTLGIPGVEVTHVWTDDPAEAPQVAAVAQIANVVAAPEDVISEVDAVVIATDKGFEHVERARPFVEAGLPVFVDKPLCDNREDLATFTRWIGARRPIISSSGMRFAKEFAPYHGATHEFGALRTVFVTMAKKWETYGIHALESIYPIVGPGFVSVRNTGSSERNVVHLKHSKGIDVVITTTADQIGGSGFVTLAGTHGGTTLRSLDTFTAFKAQLESYVGFLRTGVPPVPFAQTKELMQLLIAGIESREAGGTEILLSTFGD
ncbi:Gfo/Idh/MocA family oxidoreductase [Devosia sp.]|uniref:Gfo/Idh/MocA family oxidoreductase n=1 Tax=Devosia sp. TaxID=1871048 RepID=UPI003A94EC98